MKKIISLLIFTLCTALIFSASYDNNQYSRKSRFYLSLAQRSFDSGDYEASAEYSRQAADYAAQSEAYIQKMVARSEAETLMNTARTRLTWAKSLNAEKFFPDVYSIAVDSIALGSDAFYAEDYALSKEYAQKALDALSNVRDGIWGNEGALRWPDCQRPRRERLFCAAQGGSADLGHSAGDRAG